MTNRSHNDVKLVRREFLRIAGGGTALLGLGGLLAGCGGGQSLTITPGSSPTTGTSPTPTPTSTPPINLGQGRVLVAENPPAVGTDNGQTVVQLTTLENIDGKNYHVYGVADEGGLAQRIVQMIAWQDDPNQFVRTIFDSQSRPAQVVYGPTGHFATLNWNDDNSAVTLKAFDDALSLLGGATFRRVGDSYVIEQLSSRAVTGQVSTAVVASVSIAQVRSFVARQFGVDLLTSLLGLMNPYLLLLGAVVLLLSQAGAAALLAPGLPSIATLLVGFLILALSFGGVFGTARGQLAGGSVVAALLTTVANLFIPHTFDPQSGFYMS